MANFMDQVSGFIEVAAEYDFPSTGAQHSFSDLRNKKISVFKNEGSLTTGYLCENRVPIRSILIYWMREKKVANRVQTSKAF